MAETDTKNLFAVLHGKTEVRRLPIVQGLQEELWAKFDNQGDRLVADDVEVLDYDPSLKSTDGLAIRIPGFSIPLAVAGALENPMSIETLVFSTAAPDQIVGLFMGTMGPLPRVAFQSFSKRQLLMPGSHLLFQQGTLAGIQEPGIALADSLCALIIGDDLFVHSFAAASRVLDLTAFYAEATNAEIEIFASHGKVLCTDIGTLKSIANATVRRSITALSKSGFLDGVSVKRAKEAAARFKVDLKVAKQSGRDRILLPLERPGLLAVLRFLNEDYYESPLSEAKYVSHSKRKL